MYIPGWAQWAGVTNGKYDIKNSLVIDCPNVFTLWVFVDQGTYYVWSSTNKGNCILGCSVFYDIIENKVATYIEEHIPEWEEQT